MDQNEREARLARQKQLQERLHGNSPRLKPDSPEYHAAWAELKELEHARSPVIVKMADVEPQEVYWLWEPYIPRGKISLLEGDPGLGKTWLALNLSAVVSRGWPLPDSDGVPRGGTEPGPVLYMTAEDGLADTLRPRLDRAKANVELVSVLDGLIESDGKRAEVTLADLDVLKGALAQVRPRLVVVDPIQGYLGAGVDMHRANEVRPLLAGLARLAEEFDCAILAIRHLRKSAADNTVHRGLGSIDFAAAVRSILLVGEDPDAGGRRIMAHVKSNLAPQGPSQSYEIADGEFRWTGVSELKAQDLTAPEEPARVGAREEAEQFLRETLAGGPLEAKTIWKQSAELAIPRNTLKRAKAHLGVRAKRDGFGPGGRWLWQLPPNDHRGQRGLEDSLGPYGPYGDGERGAEA